MGLINYSSMAVRSVLPLIWVATVAGPQNYLFLDSFIHSFILTIGNSDVLAVNNFPAVYFFNFFFSYEGSTISQKREEGYRPQIHFTFSLSPLKPVYAICLVVFHDRVKLLAFAVIPVTALKHRARGSPLLLHHRSEIINGKLQITLWRFWKYHPTKPVFPLKKQIMWCACERVFVTTAAIPRTVILYGTQCKRPRGM